MDSPATKGSTARRFLRLLSGVAVGLGLLAAGTWLLILSLEEPQVLFQGKSLYYWSQEIQSPNSVGSNQACLVLNREIIPRLTKSMFEDTNDSSLRLTLIENLNGLPGVDIHFRIA